MMIRDDDDGDDDDCVRCSPSPPTACHSLAEECLTRVLDTSKIPLFCTLRTRKRCEVWQGGSLQCVHHTLNEVVVDRWVGLLLQNMVNPFRLWATDKIL